MRSSSAAARNLGLSTATLSRRICAFEQQMGSVSGTQGTDHGTGGAAFVLGGAVKGGRVLAEWPGLAKIDRNDRRDLKITTDLRAALRPILAHHLQVARATLDSSVLPGSSAIRALDLLI